LDDIALLTVVIALVFAAIGVSTPLMTLYLQSLGADYSHIALIMASTAAMGLAGSYAWGRASDALRRRKPLIAAGLAGLAVAYLLLSLVVSPGWAWIVRLFEAASMAAYSTASLALMGDLIAARDRRGQRMGSYRGIGSLAFAGGALVGGRLADASSLRTTFDLCAALYLLAAVAALIIKELPARQTTGSENRLAPAQVGPQRPWRARLAGWRPGLPVLFLSGVFLFMLAWNGQASMWPNYLAAMGHSKTAISSLWALAGLVEAPSMWLAGGWSDLLGREALLAAGGVGAAVLILSYALLARLLPALVGIQLVRGLTFGSYTATSMTAAVEGGDERHRGSNSGLFNMVGSAGQLAGLLMGGTLAQVGGFGMMFTTFSLAAALAAGCFFALWRGKRPRKPVIAGETISA
jgi:DHA1 family tetracycline resistance protein-like MFS transporter